MSPEAKSNKMNNTVNKNISTDLLKELETKHLHHFIGCGNELGIVPLNLVGYQPDDITWKDDRDLRELLANWGKKIESDSIMVLTGDPTKFADQKFHVSMTVFEPCGSDDNKERNLPGGLSTMCGNGVRAVAAYVREFDPSLTEIIVKTGSGTLKIKYEPETDLYVVEMGEFTSKENDLFAYVNTKEASPNIFHRYIDAPIPESVLGKLSKYISAKTWSIGLNGNRDNGHIDGEPHLVIEVTPEEAPDIEALRKIAVAVGPLTTKNSGLFPQEINTNFIVFNGKVGREGNTFSILNSTHERNLGDDADHSVTEACGTGSTVAAGVIMEKYMTGPNKSVIVKNRGGDLTISPDPNLPKGLLMKGDAKRV